MARNTLSLNKNKGKKKNETVEFVDDTLDITDTVAEAAAVKAEADRLEAHLANGDEQDRAALALLELRTFQPNVLTRQLIELAVLNQCNEPSAKLEGDAREKALWRKEMLELSGHDIGKCCALIAESAPLNDAPALVFSVCYNTCKALTFVTNSLYRKCLDPKADWDLEQFVDRREQERDAPYGLERDSETFEGDITILKSRIYVNAPENVLLDAMEEARMFLSLMTEAFGFFMEDAGGMLPFMYDAHPDGTFKPVYDAELALDATEVKRLASRAKREVEQAEARKKTLDMAKKVAAGLFARRS